MKKFLTNHRKAASKFSFQIRVHALQNVNLSGRTVFVRWRRGSKRSGATKAGIATKERMVWEENVEFPCTLYRNENDREYEKKQLHLEVSEGVDKKKAKALGIVVLNLAHFAPHDGYSGTDDFPLQHCKDKKTTLRLSIRSQFVKGAAGDDEDSVASSLASSSQGFPGLEDSVADDDDNPFTEGIDVVGHDGSSGEDEPPQPPSLSRSVSRADDKPAPHHRRAASASQSRPSDDDGVVFLSVEGETSAPTTSADIPIGKRSPVPPERALERTSSTPLRPPKPEETNGTRNSSTTNVGAKSEDRSTAEGKKVAALKQAIDMVTHQERELSHLKSQLRKLTSEVDEGLLIEHAIYLIAEGHSSVDVPPSAWVVFQCLVQWQSLECYEPTPFLARLLKAIAVCVQRSIHDEEMLIYWVNNTSYLVSLLNADPRVDCSIAGALTFLTALSECAQDSFGKLITVFYANVEPLVDAIISAQVGVGSQAMSGSAPARSEKASEQRVNAVTACLSQMVMRLQRCRVAPCLGRLVLAQLLTRLDAVLFNAILDKRELCSWQGAMQMKMIASKVEDWARKAGAEWDHISEGGGSDVWALSYTRQATDVLMLEKAAVVEATVRSDLCPLLNLRQIRTLLDNFTPDSFAPDTVPPAVLLTLDKLIGKKDKTRLKLDTHTMLPLPRSMGVELPERGSVHLPIIDGLQERARFQFLWESE